MIFLHPKKHYHFLGSFAISTFQFPLVWTLTRMKAMKMSANPRQILLLVVAPSVEDGWNVDVDEWPPLWSKVPGPANAIENSIPGFGG